MERYYSNDDSGKDQSHGDVELHDECCEQMVLTGKSSHDLDLGDPAAGRYSLTDK